MNRTRPRPTDDGRTPQESSTAGVPASSRARGGRTGLVAGAIATVVMTAFRMPISRTPPPPTRLAAIILGGEPADHTIVGLVGHLAYGTVAGGVFGALVSPLLRGEDLGDGRRGALLGALYGLVLSAFGSAVLLNRLLGVDPDGDERFVFHVGHLIYGLTLGILLGSRS